MRKLKELVSDWEEKERPVASLLDTESLIANAVAATRFYAGFSGLCVEKHGEGHPLVPSFENITGDTEINTSEWALIRPLFLLYVEKEEARQLEASRGMGLDPYGRSSSEVQSEITQYENDLARKAFCVPFQTV